MGSASRERARTFTYTADCIIIGDAVTPLFPQPFFRDFLPMPPIENKAPASRRPLLASTSMILPLVLCGALLTACGKEGASTAAAPPPVPVHIVKVEPRSVPISFSVPGQVEGSRQVEVRARVSGILQKQFYNEGDAVKEGAPLFEIDRAPFEVALAQAKGQLATATAQIDQARREETRLKPLVDERAVSRKEFDDATSARQLGEASLQQANATVRQAELNLSYTRVNAPVAGISGRAEHSVGTLITTDANGSLLTTINQLSPIWVRFSLAESDLAKIPGGRIGRDNRLEVQLVTSDGKPFTGKGRLNFAATAIDAHLGTQQLRAVFDNAKEQLLPGQFVNVNISAGTRDNVYLVPQTAVIQTEKANLVFVVDAQGNAQAQTVQTGDWIGSDWAIVSGLKTGDRVIVDNLLKVRPGVPVVEAAAPPAPASTSTPAAAPAK
jgi:membrane fusion protein, multidrug efflux system